MKIVKCKKLACSQYDKKENVVYIRTLKQALNLGLAFWKVCRVIRFNKKNTSLAKNIDWYEDKSKIKNKKYFEIDFFNLMINSVFVKTMVNARKHREFRLVTTEKKGII